MRGLEEAPECLVEKEEPGEQFPLRGEVPPLARVFLVTCYVEAMLFIALLWGFLLLFFGGRSYSTPVSRDARAVPYMEAPWPKEPP